MDTLKIVTAVVLALPGIFSSVNYIKSRATIKVAGEAGKPGWKTSEFWLTVLLNLPAAVVGILQQADK